MYFRETSASFPFPANVLGRCLGLAKKNGNEMTQWIIFKNGQIAPRRTVRRLTPEEMSRNTEMSKRKEFDEATRVKFGDSLSLPTRQRKIVDNVDGFDLPFDEVDLQTPEADLTDSEGRTLCDLSLVNQIINTAVLLP